MDRLDGRKPVSFDSSDIWHGIIGSILAALLVLLPWLTNGRFGPNGWRYRAAGNASRPTTGREPVAVAVRTPPVATPAKLPKVAAAPPVATPAKLPKVAAAPPVTTPAKPPKVTAAPPVATPAKPPKVAAAPPQPVPTHQPRATVAPQVTATPLRIASVPTPVRVERAPVAVPRQAPVPPNGAPVAPVQISAARVYFEADSVGVPRDANEALGAVAAYLKAHPEAKAVITGFRDPREKVSAIPQGDLATRRASRVRERLQILGIPNGRIVTEGPLEATGTPAEVRRVEVWVR